MYATVHTYMKYEGSRAVHKINKNLYSVSHLTVKSVLVI
jgi:hypothetical protein